MSLGSQFYRAAEGFDRLVVQILVVVGGAEIAIRGGGVWP